MSTLFRTVDFLSSHSDKDKWRMSLKWSFGRARRHVRLFLWTTRCIGDFLYFCKRCLALISCLSGVPVYVVLHEANVAVDFSFSSLSLCDIVYWEKCEVFIWVFFISKEDTVITFDIAISHDAVLKLTSEKLCLFSQCCFYVVISGCLWTEVGSSFELHSLSDFLKKFYLT